jgi:hypothetical protein
LISERIEAWEKQFCKFLKLAQVPGKVCAGTTVAGIERICGSLNLIINIIVGYEEEDDRVSGWEYVKKRGKTIYSQSCWEEVKLLRLTSIPGASFKGKYRFVCYGG